MSSNGVSTPVKELSYDPVSEVEQSPEQKPSLLAKTLSRLSRRRSASVKLQKIRKRDFGFLPIPKHNRHDPNLPPEQQPKFTWRTNVVFALASTSSVMNLYYVQPMLVAIATDLNVSNQTVSRIPTLLQGGYGTGILFVSPLGDLLRRRQLVLALFLVCSLLQIGLALAKNVQMLEGISFLVGICSVSAQVCIPWTADLAPANIRARSMSITLSGLISGLVIGRVLGGVFSTYASWRDTYWWAMALQIFILSLLYLGLPDTPDKGVKVPYFKFILSMFKYLYKYPTLTQASICFCFSSACFAGFWTTMTFVLSSDPYHYSPFDIGLFGLLGIIGALMAPQWGRLVDRIVPWTGQIIGFCVTTASMIIALAGATKSIGPICVAMVMYDAGSQLAQVASTYRIAGLEPQARARMNGCFLLLMFIGQTSGTAIMTKVYNTHGWYATGATAVAFQGLVLLTLLVRGPHEPGWFGWSGGTQLFRRDKLTDLSPTAITEGKHHLLKHKSKHSHEDVVEMGAVYEKGKRVNRPQSPVQSMNPEQLSKLESGRKEKEKDNEKSEGKVIEGEESEEVREIQRVFAAGHSADTA
ncbi:hypothetical protein TREMEDRAFT_65551 [Tremella mesenterica DSM 1558]|uniref:uncharacterized protein n=1 Tax=Tremella mesenterica (strain ATCC 24925 / CBS 8224 / DSM 1558 / NBRC 9311 / NRRL Y-6157 / RJB 2259-6 / UBC 559-6) TaxID=578456 RepID=UPI00032C2511|nr:uncharacterized protein TREMEDRAFT_65551 [Tremella mesenterica DSM 1558]EIW66281.1 hypothetical protein TREMEDRAFT_65551 [Tremella mesenterica DSM 1558]